MAKQRFRDIKQGKVTQKEQKKSKSDKNSFIIASKRDYFKAFLTDSFMLLMPIMYIVFYAVFDGREGFAAHKLLGWLYILVPLTIIEAIFLIKNAQTPGMKAYNLKLIFIPTNSKPDATTIWLRQILSKISFLTFAWIAIFFSKDRRTLPDKIAGTAIVYENSTK
jgi:uncharacterized RDD family membrane protein YckC